MRTYWSPESVKRVTGKALRGKASEGILHLINSGAATLDATGEMTEDGKAVMKPFWEITPAEVERCLSPRLGARRCWNMSVEEIFLAIPDQRRDAGDDVENQFNRGTGPCVATGGRPCGRYTGGRSQDSESAHQSHVADDVVCADPHGEWSVP